MHDGLQSISIIKTKGNAVIDKTHIDILVDKWKRSFDLDFGGMAKVPKFMLPNNYQFLLRFAHQNNDVNLLDFVNLTATKMAYGGLFDTIAGGFSRYSVDQKWHVPHFEKMLYDNAQLISLYADLYRVTKNEHYREVVQKTIKFVDAEFSNHEGGFFSALDADSLNFEGRLEEGAFYVWTKAELQDILEDDFAIFSAIFNINEFGYWEHENYVLIQNDSLQNIAKQVGLEEDDLHSKKVVWEKMLYQHRKTRSKPRLDDKSLTSWNAMMGKALIDAFTAFGDTSYCDKALACADYILSKCYSVHGSLSHSYKDEKATIDGFLEDYAHTISFLIAIYQVTFDEKWVNRAKQLSDYCIENFYTDSGFFAFTSTTNDALITRHFETEDNVIPASNSVMARNLLKLAVYYEDANYQAIAHNMINSIIVDVDYPSAYSNWLMAYLEKDHSNIELAISSKNAAAIAVGLQRNYLPNVTFAGTIKLSELPILNGRYVRDANTYYLCQNRSCNAPTTNLTEIKQQLNLIS